MKKIFLWCILTIPLFSDTLNSLINYALKHSVVINQTKTQYEIAKLSHKQSRSKQFGELDGVGSYTHYNIERTLAPLPPSAMMSGKPITTTKDIYSAGVNYSVPLFTGFGMTRGIEIANIAKEMSKAKTKLTKEELVYNIRALYLSILALIDMKKAQESYISALEKLKKDIAYKVQLGKKAEVDLIKSDADIEEAKANLENILANIQITKSTLSALVGKKVKYVKPIKFTIKRKTYSVDSLYKKAANLQKIKVEELAVKKADKFVKKSKSSLYPQLSLNAYYGKNYGKDIKTGVRDDEELYQVGVNAKYDLIDFGKTSTEIQKAKLEKLQAKLKKTQALLDLKKLIVKAVSQIKRDEALYRSNYQRYKLSKKSAQIESVRYNNDVSTLNDLLLAKAKTNLAKAKLIESRYNYKKSVYFLDYIMERGVKDE